MPTVIPDLHHKLIHAADHHLARRSSGLRGTMRAEDDD
jgi:hypothetical protein